MDLVKTRLSLAGDYQGIWRTLKRVASEEGFFGLYCGLSAALGVAVPQIAINYSVYGSLKSKIRECDCSLFLEPETGNITSIGCILSGALSGITASLLTFPADLLRRRLQIRGATIVGGVRISAITEIRKILK